MQTVKHESLKDYWDLCGKSGIVSHKLTHDFGPKFEQFFLLTVITFACGQT